MSAWERQAFAGRPELVSAARAWVREHLHAAGIGGALADDAELCVSELAGNAVRYSRSGGPDGTYTVGVQVDAHTVSVEVIDAGGDATPTPRTGVGDGRAESGRGLLVVICLGALYTHPDPDGPGRRVGVVLSREAAAQAAAGRGGVA